VATKVYPYPVRSEPLTLSPSTKSITVVSSPGDEIIRISTDGTALYKFPQQTSVTTTHVGTSTMTSVDIPHWPPAPRHYATDAQGDLYIADAPSHVIYKISPSGELLMTLTEAATKVTKPESIAVDDTGNIYVIDVSTLKVIPAVPAQ